MTRRELALLAMTAPLAACGGEHAAERARGILYGRAVSNTPVNTPWDAQWKHFRENIAKDASIRLDYFNLAETGGEEQQLFDLRRGRAAIGGLSLQGLASTVPELSVCMAPFLFESEVEVDFVYDTVLLKLFRELFEAKGLFLMQWTEVGWTGIYSNGPIRTPDEARGRKLRGSPNAAAQAFLAAIGADSIPLATPEVVPAMQTGLITGGLANAVFHAFSTRAFATDFTVTNHSFDTGAVVANLDWWKSATPAQLQTLSTAWMSPAEARKLTRNLNAIVLADLASPREKEKFRPAAVHQLDEASRETWRAATKDVAASLVARIGGRAGEVYAAIERAKLEFAATGGA